MTRFESVERCRSLKFDPNLGLFPSIFLFVFLGSCYRLLRVLWLVDLGVISAFFVVVVVVVVVVGGGGGGGVGVVLGV